MNNSFFEQIDGPRSIAQVPVLALSMLSEMVLELARLVQTSAPLTASCVVLLALVFPVCNMEHAVILLTSWGCGKIH